MQEADKLIQMLQWPKVAIDTETTGLEESDLPFGFAVATPTESHFFDARTMPQVWNILADHTPEHVVNQNVKFDLTMLRKRAPRFKANAYTELTALARLARNDHMAYNLATQAKRMGFEKDKTVDDYIKSNKLYDVRTYRDGETYKVPRFQDVPPDIIAKYAAHDARIAFDMSELYLKEIPNSAALFIEQDMIEVCYAMERRGLLLDECYTVAALEYESGKIKQGYNQYHELTNDEFVNSAKSVQRHLSLELPKTEDGNPSLDDDVVDSILTGPDWTDKDKKIAETVRFIRGYQKRVSTYYQSYLNLADSLNIIHPFMWSAGTRTGRFSYSDPNLQNIPKEEDSTDRYVVRGCFKPRAGRRYVSFDYSQMEYKLAADYAGETKVLEAVARGEDFHQATATMVGITRKQAKTLNFAVLYGAGTKKIAGMLGTTERGARELKDRYFMGLPKIERLIDKVIQTGRERGHVNTWTQRRMFAGKEFCYALPNHLIQSGGADVVKMAMIQIHREMPELMMVLQIHDQLVFELTDDEMKYIPRIKEIMESQYKPFNGVKLTVDVSVSKNSLAERDMEKWSA